MSRLKCPMCSGKVIDVLHDDGWTLEAICIDCSSHFFNKKISVKVIKVYSDNTTEDSTMELLELIETDILKDMLEGNEEEQNYEVCNAIKNVLEKRITCH